MNSFGILNIKWPEIDKLLLILPSLNEGYGDRYEINSGDRVVKA